MRTPWHLLIPLLAAASVACGVCSGDQTASATLPAIAGSNPSGEQPAILLQAPNVVQIPVPPIPNAEAIWGATGRDSRGHIWIGLSTRRVFSPPSAHLLEYVPESGEMIDRGCVVTELRRIGLWRRDEGQSKIHTRIIEASDGHLYFASMDMEGADLADGTTPPIWGSHLWRIRLPDYRWEHLMSAPEGLIALAGGGRYVYALGFFGHKLYQYDCETGRTQSVEVGCIGGHISRNIVSDHREHVHVPRLKRKRWDTRIVASLVEYDARLREVGETPLLHYLERSPAYSHGIVAFQHMADNSICFVAHPGYLYRILPEGRKRAKVEEIGWLHPDGARYVASLFTYTGRRYLLGLSTGDRDTGGGKTYEWVEYDLEKRHAVMMPFAIGSPDAPPLNYSLLYGSVTRDNDGNFYVVGTHHPKKEPLVLQVQPPTDKTGSLRVLLEPPSAREGDVRWRVDGAAWHGSGETESGLRPGAHVLEHNAGVAWATPPAEWFRIAPQEMLEFVRKCTPIGEFVVDNRDESEWKRFRIVDGKWGTNSVGTAKWPPDDTRADYRYVRATSGPESARAEWVHDGIPAGRCEILVRWPTFADYRVGANVAYEVEHAGGTSTVRVNQNERGGQWVSLGVWEFAAGPHRVQIHNGESAPGDWVVADAVSFVRVE